MFITYINIAVGLINFYSPIVSTAYGFRLAHSGQWKHAPENLFTKILLLKKFSAEGLAGKSRNV